ncbi:hypothetical protein VNO77_40254 [Canavalia gladiata]|uniref:Uncharacterized protein n=1 Tax=Canavalia gladiata TaxID=3824 RepID=A0AAN9JYN1_CANGL
MVGAFAASKHIGITKQARKVEDYPCKRRARRRRLARTQVSIKGKDGVEKEPKGLNGKQGKDKENGVLMSSNIVVTFHPTPNQPFAQTLGHSTSLAGRKGDIRGENLCMDTIHFQLEVVVAKINGRDELLESHFLPQSPPSNLVEEFSIPNKFHDNVDLGLAGHDFMELHHVGMLPLSLAGYL